MDRQVIVGKIVTPFNIIDNGVVIVENSTITYVGLNDSQLLAKENEILDYSSSYIIPGFIDIHCHGSEPGMCYEVDPRLFARHHLKHGTTGLLPTLVYNQTHQEIIDSLQRIVTVLEDDHDTNMIGIHMEGPYINPKYGAITIKIPKVNEKEYKEILDVAGEHIKVWTLAPELDGQEKFMQYANKYNIVFSVGHSEAAPEDIFKSVKYGMKLGCHLTNASGVTPNRSRFSGTREIGVHEAVLLHDDMYAEVIPDKDGIHVRPLMLQLIVKTKGVDKVIIITDANGYIGEDGKDVRYIKRPSSTSERTNKNAYMLSGSLLTMDRAVANMINHTGVGILEASKMASHNPAKLLGIDYRVGTLEVGKTANILAVTDNIDIQMVMLNGKILDK